MKTGTIAAAVGVVIIVLIVGYFALRPQATEAPTPSPTPAFEDVSAPTTNVSLQQTSPTPLSSPAVVTSPATSPASAVTISVDESGFTPATVTITAGTTVTFVNNGQAKHWPASDVHPTHEILPEFDSKRGLATGETYSHTFTKVGTWPMHDHLAPSNTGTITVQ